jgi:hypothetical protein
LVLRRRKEGRQPSINRRFTELNVKKLPQKWLRTWDGKKVLKRLVEYEDLLNAIR